MPYDDSNIRRMIRDQTERRVGFSHSRHVTEAARNLIHSILESDVSKRFVNKPHYYTTILKKQNVEVKACVHCPQSHVARVIQKLHVYVCLIEPEDTSGVDKAGSADDFAPCPPRSFYLSVLLGIATLQF